MKETKIKVLNLYNKAALDMAYNMGATKKNAKEIAGKLKLVDVVAYVKQRGAKNV